MSNPIITCSVVDVNSTTLSLTGNKNVLVRYHSNAQATMSAQAQDGAAIDEDMYIIKHGPETGYGKSHTFIGAQYEAFFFSAQDSMGRYTREILEPTMIKYIKPTCNVRSVSITGSGNANLSCYGVCFTGSFGVRTNTLTVSYRYRKSGGSWSSLGYMTVDASNDYYTATANATGLDFAATYDFEFYVSDELEEVTNSVKNITSTPVFHWSKSDFVFEVPVTFKAGAEGIDSASGADGDMLITGDLRLKGDGNYGNTINFGDGDYCYICENSDDELTIYARSKINLNSNSVLINGGEVAASESGVWTPTLSYVSPTYYTQEGWYTKSGNIVTVGFYIKARCPSGSSEELVIISGLPYTPYEMAAGGGLCSGAYMLSNKNFQCFVAETNGTITTRAQNCDDTANTELVTSASACFYPDAETLTVSGTITYMT